MKNVLVYCRQIQAVKNPIAVSYRNAEIIAEELGADLLMFKNDKLRHDYYDVILVPYFNRYTDYKTLKTLINSNQKRFLLRTEYEPVVVSMKEFKPYSELGQNFERPELFLNLNLLIARKPNQLTEKKYDCIYYSRYRAQRMEYCREYLQGNIYLSTHPKNHKHYFHAGCRPKLIKHVDWTEGREPLNLFRYSLYMEDPFSHKTFTGLGSRWYEAGFCNNVVFFDYRCENTIRKSEIAPYWPEIQNYIVHSHTELVQRIAECNQDWERHLMIQKGWRVNELHERAAMLNKLKQIIGID
jgi:hypothetical protein